MVDKFGTDARSISRTLENIKDPEQVEKAVQTENVEKFIKEINKLKINFFFSLIQIIRKFMQWNKKYDYPSSSRATVDGIRRYILGESNYLVLHQF